VKVYCPECETACSDQAPFCPQCGHPLLVPPPQQPTKVVYARPPKKQYSLGGLFKLIVALIFGWFVWVCAGICTTTLDDAGKAWDETKTSSGTASTNKTKPEPEKIRITALAEMGVSTVTIRNADDFDWFSVQLRIPAPGLFNILGYRFDAGTIKAGEGMEIRLANFVDSDGNRFQPLQKAAKQLFLSMYNKDGLEGTAAWQY